MPAAATRADAPRKVALIAHCLLNQNAKVCDGARYPSLVGPVVTALRDRGYRLLQLPCPELAFAGVRRWWAVYEQYDTPGLSRTLPPSRPGHRTADRAAYPARR